MPPCSGFTTAFSGRGRAGCVYFVSSGTGPLPLRLISALPSSFRALLFRGAGYAGSRPIGPVALMWEQAAARCKSITVKQCSLRAPPTGPRLLRALGLLSEETHRGQTQSSNPERQFNVAFDKQRKDLLRTRELPYEMRPVEAFYESVPFWNVAYNELLPL